MQQSQSLNSSAPAHRPLQRQLSAHSDCLASPGQAAGSRRSSFKRHKSLSVEKHARVAQVKERNYSSTDNLAGQHGFGKPKLKFRKAVSLASRLHSSPSTGRKLANYHLIASTKSGEAPFFMHPEPSLVPLPPRVLLAPHQGCESHAVKRELNTLF